VASSIGNDELNAENTFDCFRSLASTSIQKLGKRVKEDQFHVAAITFATEANILFDFNSHIDDRGSIIASLQNVPYPNYGSSESETNLHLALMKVRTDLMTEKHGYTDTSRPMVVVVLSDGQVRSNPASNPVLCAGLTNLQFNTCGDTACGRTFPCHIHNQNHSQVGFWDTR
jgi:Mg-chelatase subunit ChlD